MRELLYIRPICRFGIFLSVGFLLINPVPVFAANYSAGNYGAGNYGEGGGEATISISTPDDISLGTIMGTGESSVGEATWTVITDNSAGYRLEWQASSATMSSGSDSIAAYTPAITDTPETWSVAAPDSEWGARLKSTSTDYASGTWGSDDTTNSKWLNVKNSALFQIASRNSATAGSDQIVQFKAEIGANKLQATGNYTVNVTMTATTL
jgi:hypothetical protein